MTEDVFLKCRDVRKDMSDIQKQIHKLVDEVNRLEEVSDTVKGTRPDGTYGIIKISGYPTPEYDRKQKKIAHLKTMLDCKEADLYEAMADVEECIEKLEDPEMRVMFRLYYLDGITWQKVAREMSKLYPGRRYTENSCHMRKSRFFKEDK